MIVIVSVDPGISNFAFGVYGANYDNQGNLVVVCCFYKTTLSISNFCNHDACCTPRPKQNTVKARVSHVIDHYKRWFDNADFIVCERQSPAIATARVDEVIYALYPQTVGLSVAEIATMFGLRKFKLRAMRKRASIELAQRSGIFDNQEINDHEADTYMFAVFFAKTRKRSRHFSSFSHSPPSNLLAGYQTPAAQ